MVAGPPRPDVAVPAVVQAIAAGESTSAVWGNELGGVTFAVGSGPGRYVKWNPAGSPVDLVAEAARLRWASAYVNVPSVIDLGADEDGSWLVTAALPGENAVTARWTADATTAVRAVGEGLRHLHDAMPTHRCPFSWSIESRLAYVEEQASKGALAHVVPGGWSDDFAGLSVEQALAEIRDPPEIERLVVCHGDACAPNTIIGENGRWIGHVDFGWLGVADRWADLAVATWSTIWNYGPGWESELLVAYGIGADADRVRYYRLLWMFGP